MRALYIRKPKLLYLSTIVILSCLMVMMEQVIAQQRTLEQSTQPDVFDQLQQNAWYLPTSDSQSVLYITELGKNGPPVVVLHGGPGNDFNYLVKPVRKNLDDHKFILFDQRGSLLSPVPDSVVTKLSINILVVDLETLRRSLGQEKLVLLGHSFGTFFGDGILPQKPGTC